MKTAVEELQIVEEKLIECLDTDSLLVCFIVSELIESLRAKVNTIKSNGIS